MEELLRKDFFFLKILNNNKGAEAALPAKLTHRLIHPWSNHCRKQKHKTRVVGGHQG
jgi:hypothetical protein